ncbi:unnamed protein product [Hermetia illucens]|uniref:Chitin-binding type-2 domain-containing protein n=1 Tax=Hermetia illucens TaxID=343691 RepID=A0A7R8YZC0_HERIL|nr:mucin-5AC-like [Hermetia illucens]CAD7089852.1 unnamed protein product [Hermetia illucens]
MKYLLILGTLVVLAAGQNYKPVVFINDGSFTCTAAGAFADPSDSGKFYYCVYTGSGYLSTLISCSNGYAFDAKSQQCAMQTPNQSRDGDSTPAPITTTAVPSSTASPTTVAVTTEAQPTTIVSTKTGGPDSTSAATKLETTTIASTTPTPIITTEVLTTTTKVVSTTEQSTTPKVEPTTEKPISTTTQQSTTEASTPTTNDGTFVCTALGAFPNPLTNKSFYYCVSENAGGYTSIKIECGEGTEYISSIETCGISGDVQPVTENPSATTLEPEPFVCPGAGFFPDTSDETKFYYCFSDGKGGYIPVDLNCGAGAKFIANLGGCGIPTPDEVPTTTEANSDFKCSVEGAFADPDSDSNFYFCFPNGEGGFIPITLSCGADQVFDADLLECVDLDISSTESPAESSTPLPIVCSAEGVFADPEDDTKFFYCFENPDGSGYREVLFTCPLGLVFDNQKKFCSKSEVSQSSTEAATTLQPESTETTEQDNETTTLAPFSCTQNGMFADPSNDEHFYICIFDGFGYITISLQCTKDMVFIPDLYRCAPPDTPVPPPAPIKCNSVGYYPDPDSCQNYYYCYSNFDGGYLTIKMTCPPGTNYFANMQICVTDKVLKCKDGHDDDDDDDDEGSGSISTTEASEETTSTTTAKPKFQCPGAGNFADPDDDHKYYKCKYKHGGKLEASKKKCDHGSQFSASKHKCVSDDDWSWWWW